MSIKLDTSKFVKNLALKNKLVPHLDRAIARGEFKWEYKFPGPRQPDQAWHPSGDCTPSVYDLWHKATGKPEERVLPASPLKTFQLANISRSTVTNCRYWCQKWPTWKVFSSEAGSTLSSGFPVALCHRS